MLPASPADAGYAETSWVWAQAPLRSKSYEEHVRFNSKLQGTEIEFYKTARPAATPYLRA